MRLLAALALPGLASAAVAAVAAEQLFGRACIADDCLRAVRASSFTTRHGTADCQSYFRATVTPDTVAVTVTSTVSTYTVQTTLYTDHTVVFVTKTFTTTGTVTTTVPFGAAAKNKRAVTVSPSNIPAYASPCSGSVRYSSACACVGAVPTTVTVAAPQSTGSTTVTIVASTSTATTTVTTETSTSTDVTTIGVLTTTTATATPTGSWDCRPSYGGGSFAIFVNNCGADDGCFCVPRKSDGPRSEHGSCVYGFQGCGSVCSADSDCGAGKACFIALSVCGAADQGHCEYVNDPRCANPASAVKRALAAFQVSSSDGPFIMDGLREE